ncbi:MAG: DEAD/DEAH box helicase family protein [Mycobacteriales bacterium]|nr:DEAD/DEAH box helicase family protein [Mycobacteriales bacterium]
MAGSHTELRFEEAIEAHLLVSGWYSGVANNYRPALGLDTAELYTFIGATQPMEWERLLGLHGGADVAQRKFAERLAAEIDQRGTVDVLRRGVVDLGVRISLAYFRPAHEITPDLLTLYDANRCTVTRQVHFSSDDTDKSMDLVLSVNGLPVATAELKNPLTGQGVHHAVRQYREDRKPTEMLFAKRAVVHFAVDPDEVYLTTRLEGRSTRFLPFNQGSGGPGQSGGAGNPSHPSGYASAYLWEQVWQRDAWLDLLARYVHVEVESKGKKTANKPTVFPRYHQWHAVHTLTSHAATQGAGTNYLIQHSAGSGKSNTIAWLAHRLSSLHTPADLALLKEGLTPNSKVFDKVIVITDRVVLDRQLQDTIFQFDHTVGVVKKIDESSSQLAEALSGETAKVIITTLQKFPFILDQAAKALAGRTFAVIVDEAHSSQTGESAKALKVVLGQAAREVVAVGQGDNGVEAVFNAAEKLESKIEAGDDPQDVLAASVAARGRQPNLSFFAFTATPKAKTLELFGTKSDLDGLHRAFHLYSMRQAIEEGFILDVLSNYITYSTYFKLANASNDDPEVDQRKATAALARFVSLHPTNLAQKAEVIVEHFRRVTAKKINGKGKAMVVTRSRLHAVKYFEAITGYIEEKGYTDCRALVAFSGTVLDPDLGEEVTYTESFLNGFPESETAKRFATDEYQVLIVAEKFQTGFDQPLLHTMYVDKKLEGVKAVQTLSRLNRTIPGVKTDTFVLDFVNSAEDIQAAFKPFYDATVTEPTDPNLLYNASARLDGYQVIDTADVTGLVTAYLALDPHTKESAHAALYRHTEPARDRYQALDPADREEFRAALRDYVRMYAFLAQVLPFTDTQLESLYLYGRFLLPRLPREHDGAVDLGDDVVLAALRTETTGTFDVSLGAGDGEQVLPMAFSGDGSGGMNAAKQAALSTIIETLNDKFGSNLGQADLLWAEQQLTVTMEDPEIRASALANSEQNFGYTFDKRFEGLVIDRHDANGEMLRRFLDQPEFASLFTTWARGETFRQIREQAEGA